MGALDIMTVQVHNEDASGKVNNATFQFDAIWTPGTQEDVFEDCRDLVQSAFDGYNVTIFAYGQTGAGKTFTMAGGPGEQEGVTPRTIREIYEVIEGSKAIRDYTVVGSMLELYRNDLVDLLIPPKRRGSMESTLEEPPKLNVKADHVTGAVTIESLTEVPCDA